ncbi:MAG: tRNA (N6-isopentenyl adenosine(37)-C2)-methylthiotransferase MiaB [Syntrophobacteraceae bacterium]|nr:tRNA (N6-isopentenyl adenosine(37)-C2)-methylthiotransferase MiaB [Syntrophobacteraceae bacterium]
MSEPLFHSCAPRLFYVRTFGCQMNEYDSLQVRRQLAALGYESVDDMARADVIFLNTCSVRDKAEQKVHSFLGSLRKLKEANPQLKIIAGGCVAQQLGKKLLARFAHLDMVVGTRAVNSIGQLLQQVEKSGGRAAFLHDAGITGTGSGCFEIAPQPGVTAPLTIMQGCNNHCAYCIVPAVRGAERSRRPEEILEEIELLEGSGVKEVLLLGQNVNSYGAGLGEKISFAGLLRRIVSESGLLRIRFTTSHPKDLTEELMLCFAELAPLCKHLHLPVQAGSDRVLSRMNRRYSAGQYLEKVRELRRICPEIALTSDVIVGFPGETEEDFRDTMELIEEVRFDNLFSFRYSDRPNTRATAFEDKVDEKISARRLAELQGRQAEIALGKNLAEAGSIREVLVEGPSKASNGQVSGRTSQNRIVNFEAPLSSTGKIVAVKITHAYLHSMVGEAIVG